MKSIEWFEKNKFKSKSFAHIKKLLQLKKEKKQTISLVIPTLNEEETIGNTINIIKSYLIDKYPLLDEIAVVDSGSTDKTEKIAKECGVDFYYASNILKRRGPAKGKGENLWKSLYVTKGDIIVFLDADIKNIHPRFVYGLIGPLLIHDNIAYTKAFYRYYKKLKDKQKIRGWGRMTELLIRPLLNMYFPRLSTIIQPSAGQFAGRRALLERLPFFTGYGVEIGLLIDIQRKFGLRKIAQVDLVRLNHRYRGTGDKGVMAFGILQVFSKRANAFGKIILVKKIRDLYRQVECHSEEGIINYEVKNVYVKEKERRPIITLKEYRNKFGKNKIWLKKLNGGKVL